MADNLIFIKIGSEGLVESFVPLALNILFTTDYDPAKDRIAMIFQAAEPIDERTEWDVPFENTDKCSFYRYSLSEAEIICQAYKNEGAEKILGKDELLKIRETEGEDDGDLYFVCAGELSFLAEVADYFLHNGDNPGDIVDMIKWLIKAEDDHVVGFFQGEEDQPPQSQAILEFIQILVDEKD